MSRRPATIAGCLALPNARENVTLAGPDTADFLNRLLTIDTRGMPVGAAQDAFLLEAKGRIQVPLTLVRLAADTFSAWVLPGSGETLVEKLDFFHFGERFTATVGHTATALYGDGAPPLVGQATDHPAPAAGRHEHGVTHLPGWPVPMLLLDADPPAQAEVVTTQTFEAHRVAFGVPGAPEFNAAYSPLDAAWLDGITEGKGCYPGQEVIERTLALGRPAIKRARVRLAGPAEPGPVTRDGAPAGALTSVAQLDGEWLAIGMLKQKRAQVGAALLRGAVGAEILEVYDLSEDR